MLPLPIHVQFLLDSLVSGGAQRQAVEIGRWLHVSGRLRVSFVVYHRLDFFAPKLAAAGIRVFGLRKRLGFDPTVVMRLRRLLATAPPDVLHAFLPPPCLYGYLATRLLSGPRRPVFVAAERSELRGANTRGLWVERLVYPRSDAVTVNAESVAREIESRLQVSAERVHYIPNGINLAEWDRAAEEECPYDMDPEHFHLALVGGLRAEKNHQVVLEALSMFTARERQGLRVWFVGGETGAPGVAERIRSSIAERRLDAIVRIVPATPRIAAVMRRLDGLVLPSAYEGFPNVLLEAMASRVPGIASRVGDVPSLLEHERTGFIVAPGDAHGLSDALRRLRALAPTARRAMGEQARRTVEQRYRLEAVATRYRVLYESLVAGRAASSRRECAPRRG